MLSIDFDEELAYKVCNTAFSALEVTLPEILDEAVWEKLAIIKELTYPLPLVVAVSPSWIEGDLEEILTRIAVSAAVGISLNKEIYKPFLSQLIRSNNLGLTILQK